MADDPVRLSRVDRWVLSNQYRILEALYPKEADSHKSAREAVESGYEGHYGTLIQHIDERGVSAEECDEVLDILSMFRALKRAGEIPGVEPRHVQFSGFDGNNEGPQISYARYFCSLDRGNFTELEHGDNFNSHMPTLDRYRRQLVKWRASKDRHTLTAEDVKRIAAAAIRGKK